MRACYLHCVSLPFSIYIEAFHLLPAGAPVHNVNAQQPYQSTHYCLCGCCLSILQGPNVRGFQAGMLGSTLYRKMWTYEMKPMSGMLSVPPRATKLGKLLAMWTKMSA